MIIHENLMITQKKKICLARVFYLYQQVEGKLINNISVYLRINCINKRLFVSFYKKMNKSNFEFSSLDESFN